MITPNNPYEHSTFMKRLGNIVGLLFAPIAGAPMETCDRVRLIAAKGIEGDRYSKGEGRYNTGNPGKRQVTIIHERAFEDTGFEFKDARRNIIISGNLEPNYLIGRHFRIINSEGALVRLRGVAYCDTCGEIYSSCGKTGFHKKFFDRGGIIAEVWDDGIINLKDSLTLCDYHGKEIVVDRKEEPQTQPA
jgi:MOSC domain-containing protein YiiM